MKFNDRQPYQDTHQGLSAEDMVRVQRAIFAAHEATLAQYIPETRNKVMAFVANLILTEKPYIWIVTENIVRLVNTIYADDLYRDYVHMLQFNFFARWGAASGKFISLVHELSWACAAGANPNDSFVAIPTEIRNRMPSQDEAVAVLTDNPWLVCLTLLRSYIVLVDPDKLVTPFGATESNVEDIVL